MSTHGGGSADAFAEIARALLAEGDVQHTLQKICDLAVETIDGCDHAGISFLAADEMHTRLRNGEEAAEAKRVANLNRCDLAFARRRGVGSFR